MLVLSQQTRISQPQNQAKIASWIRPKDLWVPQYGKCKNLARDLDTVARSTNSKYSTAYYGNGVGNDSNSINGKGFSTNGFTSNSGTWYSGLDEITIFAVATTPGLNSSNFNHLARLDADTSVAVTQLDLAVFNNAGTLRVANLLATTSVNGWVAGSFTDVRAASSIDLTQPTLYIQRWKSGTIHQAGIESIGKNSIAFVDSPLSPKPSGTLTSLNGTATPMQMHIGGLALTSGEFEWGGRIYLVGVLPYCITKEDANRLVQNPWQIFAPRRQWFALGAAASGIDLSADAQSSVTATGSITQTVALTGASVALATAAGVVNQTISIAGSAASISVANGVATITTTLTGDGFVESFASGALSNAISAAGNAQSAASAAGSLGTASSLSANATAQATATGNVNLSLTMAGTAIAQALASANLGTTNSLSADAQAAASASGALFSTLALGGAAPVAVTGSGGLISTQSLSGAALSVASGSGDISIGVGGLSANAIAEVLAGGSISLSVSLSADALARAVGNAMLTMAGAYQIPVGIHRMASVTPKYKVTHITPQRTIRSLTRAH